MRRVLVVASVLMFAAGPVLADPPVSADPQPTVAKMKKVCHPVQGSNPLYPEMKCRMVPIAETAAVKPATPDAAPTQVALHNPDTPH